MNLKKTGKNHRKKCTERKGLIIFFQIGRLMQKKRRHKHVWPKDRAATLGIVRIEKESSRTRASDLHTQDEGQTTTADSLSICLRSLGPGIKRSRSHSHGMINTFFFRFFFFDEVFSLFLYHFRFFLCSILFKFLADLVVWSFVLRRFCPETKDARRLRVSRGIDRKDRAWEHPRRTRRIVSLLICLDIGLRIEKARQWVGNGWRY